MRKSIIYIQFLIYCCLPIALPISLYSMQSTTEQPNDPQLTEIRKYLGAGIFTYKTPRLIYKENFKDRLGKCLHYILTHILGIAHNSGSLKIITTQDWNDNLNLQQYFEETIHPHIDDLAVYYADNNNPEALHFGIISNFDPITHQPLIISKWGVRPEIFEHELFAVPLIFGNSVRFFRLKSDYKTPEGKKIMLQKIIKSINASELAKKILFVIQTMLVYLAGGKDVSSLEKYIHLNKLLSSDGKVWFLLKEYPGLDVNTHNKFNQTALMLAAQSGNYKIAERLLQFGADVNKKDNNGNTALSLTTDKNIAALLMKYGAQE
ncbi:MAG TPA: ankyrin repeat domain-containing protein [Candidatus Babeliales bacterium]|nr:ankyrin repeat domain-containing protein [Candidatus Babeliales bacterium]